TRTPIVEFPDSYQEGIDKGENSSRSRLAHPGNTARTRALHPFTAAVMDERMLEKMLPKLEKYDGSGDPNEHLRLFVDAMTIYSPNENFQQLVHLDHRVSLLLLP
ncbi:hypothetical protein V8G54_003900, partial [Vigna mungo]